MGLGVSDSDRSSMVRALDRESRDEGFKSPRSPHNKEMDVRETNHLCGHRVDTECGVSTSIADELTFGCGKLDFNGYWTVPCGRRARAAEIEDEQEEGSYWPHTQKWIDDNFSDLVEEAVEYESVSRFTKLYRWIAKMVWTVHQLVRKHR